MSSCNRQFKLTTSTTVVLLIVAFCAYEYGRRQSCEHSSAEARLSLEKYKQDQSTYVQLLQQQHHQQQQQQNVVTAHRDVPLQRADKPPMVVDLEPVVPEQHITHNGIMQKQSLPSDQQPLLQCVNAVKTACDPALNAW